MKTKSNYFIFCILILLIIYQDSPLGLFLGAFGYSFLPSLSLLLLPLLGVLKGKIKISLFAQKLMLLFGYMLLISICAVIVWVVCGNSLEILGEDIIIKSVKGSLYFLSYIAFIIVIENITEGISVQLFLRPIFITFVLLTIICIVEYFLLPNAFSFIHFDSRKAYSRIRLLTQESSYTAMQIYVYGALSFYYSVTIKKNNKLFFVITTLCMGVLIYFTSSKTLMSILFVSAVVILLIYGKRSSKKQLSSIAIVLIIGALLYVFVAGKLITAVETSLQWGSIYTRTYTIFIGALIGCIYPFGTGTSLYLHLFPYYLNKYYFLLSDYDVGYALREINSYIYAVSDESLTVKSALLQYNMYWGILGTISFLRILYKYSYAKLKSLKIYVKNNVWLSMMFIVSLIMVGFSSDFSFEFWLMISFVNFLSNKNEKGEIAS